MVPVYFAEVAHFAQPAPQRSIWDPFPGAATFDACRLADQGDRVKKRLASLTAEIIWLLCFLVLVALAPTLFAKIVLLVICALLVWLYLPHKNGS